MTNHKLQFERTRIEGRLRKLEAELVQGNNAHLWKHYHHAQQSYHALRLKEYSTKQRGIND